MRKPRIIIIGGLSAGPSAAAKARRVNENAEIILFEKTAHISYATCGIPYALSGKIQSRDKLIVVQPDQLVKRFDIDLHLNEPVTDIDPNAHMVYTHKGAYQYDKLIFATGGRAILPHIEGIEEYNNWAHAKTLEDFDKIMKQDVVAKSDHITIIGAGLIGLENAENLVKIGKKVTVIELGDHVLANWDAKFATMAEKVLIDNGIDLRLKTSVVGVDATTNELILNTGERLYTDYTLIGISIRPNTEMLTSKGAEHLPNGALIVNEKMETSIEDVYAAGDCASIPHKLTGESGWFPMGTHSNKGGRTAGANAVGGESAFDGGYGTAIMKLFDFTIARTGMGPKELKRKGINFKSSFSISGTTPGFYPDQKDLFLEIYFDPETKVLLGAELMGERGVDKRVDVLSTAIYAKLTIDDLPKLDLAYAPPFSPAKDPVIVAGFVAGNSITEGYQEVSVTEADEIFSNPNISNYIILDVRNPSEIHKNGLIEDSINIPLDDLRDRLSELNKHKHIFVYCAKGLRGYLSSLILLHHGFENVSNIGGGFTAWDKIIQKSVSLELD
ncbi:FAD-dependent oxidoreductase [Marinoscillum pacificum]|uniref:FAD-dependent oxidoreductase n=1 Tax=Marinoscillum pacificum TaxID=392723 RepID=UPI00215880FE|nr:FAD-dependent oxidoreductase [Marinoscillum pacificum]